MGHHTGNESAAAETRDDFGFGSTLAFWAGITAMGLSIPVFNFAISQVDDYHVPARTHGLVILLFYALPILVLACADRIVGMRGSASVTRFRIAAMAAVGLLLAMHPPFSVLVNFNAPSTGPQPLFQAAVNLGHLSTALKIIVVLCLYGILIISTSLLRRHLIPFFVLIGVFSVLMVPYYLYGTGVFPLLRSHPADGTAALKPSDSKPPVIIIVLDEFSQAALLDEHQRISDRYPTWRILAEEGIWVHDAFTSDANTKYAIPGILTGRRNLDFKTALRETATLFSLLAGDYYQEVYGIYLGYSDALRSDPAPVFCTDEVDYHERNLLRHESNLLYAYLNQTLPDSFFHATDQDVVLRWDMDMKLTSLEQTSLFLSRLAELPLRNRLFFLHLDIPHHPFVIEADGSVTERPSALFRFDQAGRPEEVEELFEYYCREIEFLDGFLDRIRGTLKARNAWDETLLVITADHGVSWTWGNLGRGIPPVTSTVMNDQIARVPLLIKPSSLHDTPLFQGALYNGVDFLPSLMDLLGRPMETAGIHGRSIFRPAPQKAAVPLVRDFNQRLWRRNRSSGAWELVPPPA